MLLLLSPSKKLDDKRNLHSNITTLPHFKDDTQKLVQQLKKLDVDEVAKLMHLSDKLAALNYERYQDFSADYTAKNSRPALFYFKGDVYDKMDVENYNQDDLNFAQKHVRILSGIYGILRPLDLMQAYRLEMGTQFKTERGNNLYDFWDTSITDVINNEKQDVIVNLASNEYFSAVKTKQLNSKLVTIVFKQLKNSNLKTIGLMAKRARGLMADYVIKNRITQVEELKKFNVSGYQFQKDMSNDSTFVFIMDMD